MPRPWASAEPAAAAAAAAGAGGLRGPGSLGRGDEGPVLRLLIVVVQEHPDKGRLILALGEAAGQRYEPRAALRLKLVAAAEPGFQQGGHPLRDDRRHVLVAGKRPLLQVDG